MPSQDGALRGESNLVPKKLKASAMKRLSKCISELIGRGYVIYPEESTLNLFMNEVIVKTNMLHIRVEYLISTKVHRTNIITIYCWLLCERYTKLG